MSVPSRTAVITGGSGEIARATAARLVRSGYRVALADRDEAELSRASSELGCAARRVVDVRKHASVQTVLAELAEELGGISVLVNCAGVVGPNLPVAEYPEATWEEVLQVNLSGVFHACKYAIPYLLQDPAGRIVNVASMAGKEGNPPLITQNEALELLFDWVENGHAPETILATSADNTRTRNVCMYPKRQKYVGGDVNVAASYVCQ